MEMPNNTTSSASFYQKFESELTEYEKQHQGSQRKPWTTEKVAEVMNNIRKARVTMSSNQPKTAMDYYWLSKYDIMVLANEEFLIFKRKTPNDPTIRIVPRNEYFRILEEVHKSCGHGGRDKMTYGIKSRFYIPKKAIEIFLAHCPTCETKKHFPKKGIVSRPILSQDFNIRGQVDLIDFQSSPDGEYKWLLNYQDKTTKFMSLQPLKTNRPQEIATELLKIFLTLGAPYILQSNNGREFTAKIVEELTTMWPDFKIVHGSPRRPQTQGNVEKDNQDIENMLRSWMYDNKSTNWVIGCYHVQYKKNTAFHRVIGRTPYKALFGSNPRAGLSSLAIPSSTLANIDTEEQLQNLLEQESSSEKNHMGASMHAIEQSINFNSNNESEEYLNKSIIDQPECESSPTPYIKLELEPCCSNDVSTELSIDYDPNTPLKSEPSEEVPNEPYTMENNFQAQQDTHKNKNYAEIVKLENSEANFTCVVCHNACPGTHTCSSCEYFVHVICGLPNEENEGYGSKVLCILCKNEQDIQLRRNAAVKGTKRAAENVVNNTVKKLPQLKIDEAVETSVPDLPISSRETMSRQYLFGGQDFLKCICKPAPKQCRTNRCACFKKNVQCGSKCHNSLICLNK